MRPRPEKQRREELQHKNDQRNKDQRDKKDDRRSGNRTVPGEGYNLVSLSL